LLQDQIFTEFIFPLSINQYLFYLMLQNSVVTHFQLEKASETKLIPLLSSAERGLFPC